MLYDVKRKRETGDKFNATHIMDRYKLSGKQVKEYKKEFMKMFENEEEYMEYIEKNEIEKII